MILYLYIFVFLIAIIAMGISSGMVTRSFLKLSSIVGINEYVMSFIILGIITSVPELFIAITSVIVGTPLLSVGNIIGANLAAVTLTLGLVAILSDGIEMKKLISKKVYWLSLTLAILPSIMIFNGGIGRADGALLLLIFIAYLIVFSQDGRFLEKSKPHIPYGAHYLRDAYPSFISLFLGLAILLFAAFFIVIFSSGLASYFSMDLVLFGVIVLGLITTLPELFFGIRGAILRHPHLSFGNILASVVFNGTVIIGALAILSPVALKSPTTGLLPYGAATTVTAFVLLSIFSYTNSRITRLEGVLLVALYLLFLVTTFVFVL